MRIYWPTIYITSTHKEDGMTKQDLVRTLVKDTGITQDMAGKVCNAMFDIIKDALLDGDSVTLTGFGTFTVKERAARTGRNPRTGKAIDVPACRAVSFKPSKNLKEAFK